MNKYTELIKWLRSGPLNGEERHAIADALQAESEAVQTALDSLSDIAAIAKVASRKINAITENIEAVQVEPKHTDDIAVDVFAAMMKTKLAKKRDESKSGWQTCPPEILSMALREHVEKGDPIDVANYCMFLALLNKRITPQTAVQVEPVGYTDPLYLHVRQIGGFSCHYEKDPCRIFTVPIYAAPPPAPASAKPLPLTTEQDRALCEAFYNDAASEYFKARPQLESDINRRIFYAGHRKAWTEYEAAHGIKEPTK